MKKFPKPMVAIGIIVLVIATVALIVSVIKDKNVDNSDKPVVNVSSEQKPVNQPYLDRVADVEPIELPDEVAGSVGFEPKAVDKLTDRFVLRKVEEGDNSVIYYYQTHERTSGERLMLMCSMMSEEDYNQGLPELNYENMTYNGITLTYMERSLLYVPDDYEIAESIQANIDRGILVVEYGNDLEEMLSMSSMVWYENGIKYELQQRNNNVTQEEMLEMAQLIINS